MKRFTYTKLAVALLSGMVLFNSCAKKGDPGPAGDQGAQGAGFDEAVKNGNILVIFEGTSPSGVDFKDTLDHRFSHSDPYYSSVSTEGSELDFYAKRFIAYDNWLGEDEDDFFSTSLGVDIMEGDTVFGFKVSTYCSITTPSFTYFRLHSDFSNTDGENVENLQIDGLKYDPATGHLYYRFSFVAPADSNPSEHDLKVSGVVDVTLYSAI